MLPSQDDLILADGRVLPSPSAPLWGNRDFLLLWTGSLITWIGNWMLVIALPTYVYQITGSALATGGMFIAQTVPSVLLGSLAGVCVDRWDRKRTMVISDALRTFVFLPVLLVRSMHEIWLIYTVVLVEAVIAQFFNPAQTALLPRVVGEQQLLVANARSAVGSQLALLIGPALGGILFGRYGFSTVLLLDCVSFLVSSVLIALVTTHTTQHRKVRPQSSPRVMGLWKTVWWDLIEGLLLVGRTSFIRGLFVANGLLWCALGLYYVLFVIWVNRILHGGSDAYGWLLTATALGGFGGSMILGRASKTLSPRNLLAFSGVATGLIFLAVINIPIFSIDFALRVIGDVPAAILFISLQTLLQRSVTDQYRGRVFGALGATNGLMMVIGMGMASIFGDHLGVVPLLNLAGGLYISSGLAALALLPSELMTANSSRKSVEQH